MRARPLRTASGGEDWGRLGPQALQGTFVGAPGHACKQANKQKMHIRHAMACCNSLPGDPFARGTRLPAYQIPMPLMPANRPGGFGSACFGPIKRKKKNRKS